MSTENNNNNGQLAVSKIDSLKNILNADSVQAQFKNALAENSGSFVASIIDLYSGDNYLQQCEPKLVVMQALKAAVLKLPINKSLGFAFIVPFKQNGVQVPQFQIGYKGLIQLALRTKQYRIMNADVVYEGEYKTKNKLTGEFDLSGTATSDKIIGYFAHIELEGGFAKTLYMSKEKVQAHAAKYSKSYNTQYSPWKTEFDAMAIKTVLRNLLSHYGFLSVEMVNAFDNDEQDVADKVQEEIKSNANSKNMGFEEAEMVNEQQQQQPEPGERAPF
ncbi:MAG: recombinase RecT [Chitinophagales bacterium]|nr:recombinase RecT [Chitinophagales bacterium]MBP9845814.1 recombinase RecT [Saprospiraceae bacterium]